jgi:hypothetical protein
LYYTAKLVSDALHFASASALGAREVAGQQDRFAAARGSQCKLGVIYPNDIDAMAIIPKSVLLAMIMEYYVYYY